MAATPLEMEKHLKESVRNEKCIPKESGVKEAIGKYGLMWPQAYSLYHPTKPLLSTYATKDYPVLCGENWSRDYTIASIELRAHKPDR